MTGLLLIGWKNKAKFYLTNHEEQQWKAKGITKRNHSSNKSNHVPLSHTFNCASLVSFRAPMGLDKSRNVSGLSRSTGDRKKKYCCSQVCQSRYSYQNSAFKTTKKGQKPSTHSARWGEKARSYRLKHFFIPFRVSARLKGRAYTENRAASREQVASWSRWLSQFQNDHDQQTLSSVAQRHFHSLNK